MLLDFYLLDVLSEGSTITCAVFSGDPNLPGALGLKSDTFSLIEITHKHLVKDLQGFKVYKVTRFHKVKNLVKL